MSSEVENLLNLILAADTQEAFEDILSLASDDIFVTTRQTGHIIDEVLRAKIYETGMDATVSVLSRLVCYVYKLVAIKWSLIPDPSARRTCFLKQDL